MPHDLFSILKKNDKERRNSESLRRLVEEWQSAFEQLFDADRRITQRPTLKATRIVSIQDAMIADLTIRLMRADAYAE